MENKIREHVEGLKRQTNQIVRKKLAKKIQDLREDVRTMRRGIGLTGDDDEGGSEA